IAGEVRKQARDRLHPPGARADGDDPLGRAVPHPARPAGQDYPGVMLWLGAGPRLVAGPRPGRGAGAPPPPPPPRAPPARAAPPGATPPASLHEGLAITSMAPSSSPANPRSG